MQGDRQQYRNKPLRLMSVLVLLVSLLALGACGTKQKGGSSKAYAVVKTAKTQMGKKYRYGGESPQKGFDCSGLIWWAYKKHGVKVPRVTTGQAKAGRSVSKKKARPGDIVVFRTGSRTLHTGIYVGENEFIHSPRTGTRVRIESIDTPYWKDRLRTVRRIIY